MHTNICIFIYLQITHKYDWSSNIFFLHPSASSHTPRFGEHCSNEQKNKTQQNKQLLQILAMDTHTGYYS